MNFKATAFNEKGYTFLFFFSNCNWHGIDVVAREALDKVIANDKLHDKNGPWGFRNIDVTG